MKAVAARVLAVVVPLIVVWSLAIDGPSSALAQPDGAGENDAAPGPAITAENVPWAFRETATWSASARDLAHVGGRLGAKLTALHNQTFDIRGLALKINTIACETDAGAERVVSLLTTDAPAVRAVVRRGRVVMEILSANDGLREFSRHLVGGDAVAIEWRVRGKIIPCERGDATLANELFNLAIRERQTPSLATDAAHTARIAAIREQLAFADALDVRQFGSRQTFAALTFVPTAERTTAVPESAAMRFAFDAGKVSRWHEMPVVGFEFVATVRDAFAPFRADAATEADRAADGEFIVPSSPAVKSAVEAALANVPATASAREKVAAIHRWVVENLRYGGPLGSRLGVEQVLRHKQGRCWDFSDVFASMARSIGIGVREVAGWAVGLGGHIWCEAEIAPGEWLAIDCTCPWLGVSARYIGLWPANRPIAYVEFPSIEKVPAIGSDDGDDD